MVAGGVVTTVAGSPGRVRRPFSSKERLQPLVHLKRQRSRVGGAAYGSARRAGERRLRGRR